MPIQDLLPILVPGILIQFLVQAYFIRHCVTNKRLSLRRKIGYTLSIALFNIPAAAVYLLLTRERTDRRDLDLIGPSPGDQVQQGIFVLLLVTYEIFSLRLIVDNQSSQKPPWLMGMIGICFVSLILDGLLIRQNRWISWLLIGMQIASISLVVFGDNGQYAQFMVLVVLAGLLNRHPQKMALGAVGVLFATSLVAVIFKEYERTGGIGSEVFISIIYVYLLTFALIFALFYSLKKQLLANHRLTVAMQTLRDQQEQLELMSVLAERNSIVGKIHDTVGHTLTTAVLALEEGTQLLEKDPVSAAKKIELARTQVKRGLQDLRDSIRTIQSGPIRTFDEQLDQLAENLRKTTNLEVTLVLESKADLLPIQQQVLLQAIRELATNSLKHGQGRSFDILVQADRENLRVTVSDDGKGTDRVQAGFGLNHLREQVETLGGSVQFTSAAGDGFTTLIVLPVGRAKTEDPHVPH